MSLEAVFTHHAVDRYVERFAAEPATALRVLFPLLRAASPLKQKTDSGEHVWLNADAGIFFILKRDKGKWWVVTVLSREQWEASEAEHQARIEEAAQVLVPPKRSAASGQLTHIEALEAQNARLRERNKLLATEVERLLHELASFRKEERKAMAKLAGSAS